MTTVFIKMLDQVFMSTCGVNEKSLIARYNTWLLNNSENHPQCPIVLINKQPWTPKSYCHSAAYMKQKEWCLFWIKGWWRWWWHRTRPNQGFQNSRQYWSAFFVFTWRKFTCNCKFSVHQRLCTVQVKSKLLLIFQILGSLWLLRVFSGLLWATLGFLWATFGFPSFSCSPSSFRNMRVVFIDFIRNIEQNRDQQRWLE